MLHRIKQFSMDSKSLRSEFDAFDTDGNGVISKQEFMAVSGELLNYVQFMSDIWSSTQRDKGLYHMKHDT